MPFATVWMDLKIIMLSGISQKEKDNSHISLVIYITYDIYIYIYITYEPKLGHK